MIKINYMFIIIKHDYYREDYTFFYHYHQSLQSLDHLYAIIQSIEGKK